MAWKVSTFFTWCFFFGFWTFMAFHYSWAKSPSQYREIASWEKPAKPWYDASYKF